MLKDIIKMSNLEHNVEGRVCIDFTDPITNRVIERIKGNNHVWKENLFGFNGNGSYGALYDAMDKMKLEIRTYKGAIDPSFPYAQGVRIGTGIPSQGSSGTQQGAYDAANSYRNKSTSTGLASKYTYQYTPTQALGILGTLHLTYQQYFYAYGIARAAIGYLMLKNKSYHYNISTRILTKYIGYNSTDSANQVAYNLSAYANANTSSAIGCDPENGRMYFISFGTAPYKIYEFSDDTFSTLTNTYTIPTELNATYFSSSYFKESFRVRRGVAYFVNGYAAACLAFKYDMNLGKADTIIKHGDSYSGLYQTVFYSGTTYADAGDKLILTSSISGTGYTADTPIIDLVSGTVIGSCSRGNASGLNSYFPHPFYPNVFAEASAGGQFLNSGIISAYRIPDSSPTRPVGSGMTISYELEITY